MNLYKESGAQTISYAEARKLGIDAVRQVNSDCSEDCLKAQLDAHYDTSLGCNDAKLKPHSGMADKSSSAKEKAKKAEQKAKEKAKEKAKKAKDKAKEKEKATKAKAKAKAKSEKDKANSKKNAEKRATQDKKNNSDAEPI